MQILPFDTTWMCTGAGGQLCTVPWTNLRNVTEVIPSDLGTFSLYMTPFVPSICTGVISTYDFCYQFEQTRGPRPTLFTILTLEDVGSSYRIVRQDTFREERGCTTTLIGGIQECCQRIDLAEPFSVDQGYAYGILIPTTPAGNNRLLLTTGTSVGYQLAAAVYEQSISGDFISKVSLGIEDVAPDLIQEQSFQFIIGRSQWL